jgi:hypothetical protein
MDFNNQEYMVYEDVGNGNLRQYKLKGRGFLTSQNNNEILLISKKGNVITRMNNNEITAGYWILKEINKK